MKIPLVSIIIPCYNYGHYLAEAIESARAQTYFNIEIIVIDDGSTDNTKQVAKRYPVKYYYQKNQGKGAALNNGVSLSEGDFFLCLDADDKLAPSYVEKTMKVMMKNSKIGFVCTGSKVWNEDSKIEDIWIPHKIFSKYELISGWEGNLGPALIRREAFDNLDFGYDVRLPFHWDLEICLRLLSKGWKMGIIPEPLHWYRLHKGSINSDSRKNKEQLERIVEWYISKRYPWSVLYKNLYAFYRNTLGRAATFMLHPIAYFKGVRKKIEVNMLVKSNCWNNLEEFKNAQQFLREILLTVDRQIRWSWNRKLNDYYVERLRILESRLRRMLQGNHI